MAKQKWELGLEEYGSLHDDSCAIASEDECDCNMSGLRTLFNVSITEILKDDRKKLLKITNDLWLNPPWSPEWSAENYKIEGYRKAIRDIQEVLFTS